MNAYFDVMENVREAGNIEFRSVQQDEDGMRLDRWLKRHYPALPFAHLQRILRTGQVRVDGKRAKPSHRLQTGMVVRIPPLKLKTFPHLDPKYPLDKAGTDNSLPLRISDAKIQKEVTFAKSLVIHKNDDILVLDKPAGLAVQGGTATHRHLDGMLDGLKYNLSHRPMLVHRLDKDTSGVMLLARNRQSAVKLGTAFQSRQVQKIYWAISVGLPDPDAGLINLPLAKAGPAGREKMHIDWQNGKEALTKFKQIAKLGENFALIALWPQTGRTHQLRAHMAAFNMPILGDYKYGGKTAQAQIAGKRVRILHLHAAYLNLPAEILPHCSQKFTAPLPDHFSSTLDLLGFSNLTALKTGWDDV